MVIRNNTRPVCFFMCQKLNMVNYSVLFYKALRRSVLICTTHKICLFYMALSLRSFWHVHITLTIVNANSNSCKQNVSKRLSYFFHSKIFEWLYKCCKTVGTMSAMGKLIWVSVKYFDWMKWLLIASVVCVHSVCVCEKSLSYLLIECENC